MDDLQKKISDWQDATFPSATIDSMFRHMISELKELSEKLDDPHAAAEELADMQHLLFGIASKMGFSLHDITNKKFKINKKRSWGPQNEQGFIEHMEGR